MCLFFLIIVLSLVKLMLLNSKYVQVCEQVHAKNKYVHLLSLDMKCEQVVIIQT